MAGSDYVESDPRHHSSKIRRMLEDAERYTREDVKKVNDPRAQALFETSAEVLEGLGKAYDDYERRNELPWG